MFPKWNDQHWSNTVFDYESRVSHYNCNGHTLVIRRIVERLVDCCIQETDGIRRHGDQSGGGWSLTHHRITAWDQWWSFQFWGMSANMRRRQQWWWESVWSIGRDVLSDIQPLLNFLGSCGKRQDAQFAQSAPPLFWTAKGNFFHLVMRRRACSYFDVIVINRCPRNPCVRLLLSRTQHRIFRWHPVTLQ